MIVQRQREHVAQTDRIEEHNLRREIELKAEQAKELMSCLAALKHMEAYCSNHIGLDGGSRTVTEVHRQRLRRQRHESERMPRKHEQFIEKLRGELEQKLDRTCREQCRELDELTKRHQRGDEELGRIHREILVCFADVVRWRVEQMQKQWLLETMLWKQSREDAGDVHVPWPIAQLEMSQIMMDL